MPAYKHRLGNRFGNLTLMGRMKKGKACYWIMLCDCGVLSAKRAGNVMMGKTTSCGNHGHGKGRRGMDEQPSYNVAHNVVALMRGKASQYQCVDCYGEADEWSYDGNDANQLFGSRCQSDTRRMAYSLDIEHYEPRCARCHRQYDSGLRAA